MNFGEGSKIRSISVIKFLDKLRFNVDSRLLRQEVKWRSQNFKEYNAFWVKAKILEINSGISSDATVALAFKGEYHEIVSGKIILDTVSPRDFDRYSKTTPYLLSFLIDDLKPYTGKVDADVR